MMNDSPGRPATLERASYHEAAHAIFFVRHSDFRLNFVHVEELLLNVFRGHTDFEIGGKLSIDRAPRYIDVLLAGPNADLHLHRQWFKGSSLARTACEDLSIASQPCNLIANHERDARGRGVK